MYEAVMDLIMKANEDRYKEAFEDGEESGQSHTLIELVQRKLRKKKTPEIIAEELEESLANVEQICKAVDKCGLEADPQEIYDEMQNMAPAQ